MLVEEYRARFEQPEELEVPAFAADRPAAGPRHARPGRPHAAVAIAALASACSVVLFVLGITGEEMRTATTADRTPSGAAAERQGREARQRRSPAATTRRRRSRADSERTSRLTVVAARAVWVCLVDAQGQPLVGGRTLAAGEREGPFRSKRFRITVGNGGGDCAVERQAPRPARQGRCRSGYAISAAGVEAASASRSRPTCGAEDGSA